jgi:hypothetical protein
VNWIFATDLQKGQTIYLESPHVIEALDWRGDRVYVWVSGREQAYSFPEFKLINVEVAK